MKLENINRLDYLQSKYKKLATNGEGIVEYYTSVKKEYNALVNGVGIRDISHKGKLELGGKDPAATRRRV